MRTRVTLAAFVASLLVLTLVACTGADVDDRTTPTTKVDTKGGSGPDMSDVDDAASLIAAVEAYDGPYTMDGDVLLPAPRTEKVVFDGTSWQRADDPPSGVDEWRWIADDKTATCFQLVGDDWVSGLGALDVDRRDFAANVDVWTNLQYIDGDDERPLDEVVRFEATGDGWAIVVLNPPADYDARVEFVVEDGRVTGARHLLADGSLRTTQAFSFENVPVVSVPGGAEGAGEGIDVTC